MRGGGSGGGVLSIAFIKEQNELIELKREEEEYTSLYWIQIIEDLYLYKERERGEGYR